jgi:hypothetical protein
MESSHYFITPCRFAQSILPQSKPNNPILLIGMKIEFEENDIEGIPKQVQ